MIEIDINSDLGESFGAWRIGDDIDVQIMPLISSANVATGFHAGDPNIMRQTVKLAARLGVSVGAHPGFRDLVGFGRRHVNATPKELVDDMLYQLGALREFASLYGVKVRHIKPHGALYMHLAKDEAAANAFITMLQRLAPELKVFCMYGTAVWRAAVAHGQPVVCEFYADRDYDHTGSIVFTRRVTALDPDVVAAKVLRACLQGRVNTVEGGEIDVHFSSVCLHSDTPGALMLLQMIVQHLQRANITIAAPQ
jgi:UPF0271 protein